MEHHTPTPDTAETLLDANLPDAETIKAHAADPGTEQDGSTHKIDPRHWAPLRVCPQCSLAWETDADWCASCGTAFDVRERSGRGSQNTTVRIPRTRRATAGTTRNTGERAAAHPPSRRGAPPRRASRSAAPRGRSNAWFAVVALLIAIPFSALAFVAGQQTRASSEEVNQQIEQAVQQTKDSAVNSFKRNFERQRDRLQSEFETRVKAAEQQAYAEGKSNAEAQLPQGSLTEDLKRCLANFLVDC